MERIITTQTGSLLASRLLAFILGSQRSPVHTRLAAVTRHLLDRPT